MSGYLSVAQYSKKHDIDGGTIRRRIAEGRLEAVKIGSQWAIPEDAPPPKDRRVKSGKYVGWRRKPGAD